MAQLKVRGTQQISYEGIVTVSVEDNGYLLSKKTYHNEGTRKLFRFICDCLKGVYNEEDRPVKILLYTEAQSSPSAELDWSFSSAVSPFVIQEISEVSDESGTDCLTVFHFRIPYSYLRSLGDQGICKAAICQGSATSENVVDHISAKFKFTTDDGSSWDPIRIPETSGNFSIILDWSMRVSNADSLE